MCNIQNNNAWYFTREQLTNTPSIKFSGYDIHREISCRQESANFIQSMGQTLKTSQLCINTAVVYMHRFYTFHSFRHFLWYEIAAAALFLAAKVEEQPRGVKHVVRAFNTCRNVSDSTVDMNSERYKNESRDLIFHEGLLLQTLGFDVAVDHPHGHIVRWCYSSQIGNELAQTSYFMASRSLHLTTMSLQFKPTVVACFCILTASKHLRCAIPPSDDGREWYSYIDPTVTLELLEQLVEEFSVVLKTTEKPKWRADVTSDKKHHIPVPQTTPPFDCVAKKVTKGIENNPRLHETSHISKSDSPRKQVLTSTRELRNLRRHDYSVVYNRQLRDRTNRDTRYTRDETSRDSRVSRNRETQKRNVTCMSDILDPPLPYNAKKRRRRS